MPITSTSASAHYQHDVISEHRNQHESLTEPCGWISFEQNIGIFLDIAVKLRTLSCLLGAAKVNGRMS